MKKQPFGADLPPRYIADERFEVAYYARNGKKYKRVRELGLQTWGETIEQEIDPDVFWMVVACLERRNRHA